MEMALYQVIARELSFKGWVTVPDGTTDFDAWLHENGYGRDITLRRGIVREVTPAERRALHAEHDRLKAAGLLPSAAQAITGKLARGR